MAYKCDDNFFGRDNEKSFYWAGFFAADGNIDKIKPRFVLQLASKDKEHVEKLKKDLQLTSPLKDSIRNDNRPAFKSKVYYSSKIRWTSKQMAEDIKRFGITPAKSLTYDIPDDIINHPLAHHFIRGLIDGDGWIRTDGYHGYIGLCGSKKCVTKVFNFLKKKLNIDSGLIYDRKPTLTAMTFQKLEDLKKIINYLHQDYETFLTRKNNAALQILQILPVKIDIDKEHLAQLYAKHKTNFKAIADELNVSEPTIHRRLREYGIFKRVSPTGNIILDQVTKEEFLKDIKELKQLKKLAQKYNTNTGVVKRAIKLVGLNPRKNRDIKKEFPKEKLQEIYDRLKSFRAMERELKLDRRIIRTILNS